MYEDKLSTWGPGVGWAACLMLSVGMFVAGLSIGASQGVAEGRTQETVSLRRASTRIIDRYNAKHPDTPMVERPTGKRGEFAAEDDASASE
jgi:hypothetical protein